MRDCFRLVSKDVHVTSRQKNDSNRAVRPSVRRINRVDRYKRLADTEMIEKTVVLLSVVVGYIGRRIPELMCVLFSRRCIYAFHSMYARTLRLHLVCEALTAPLEGFQLFCDPNLYSLLVKFPNSRLKKNRRQVSRLRRELAEPIGSGYCISCRSRDGGWGCSRRRAVRCPRKSIVVVSVASTCLQLVTVIAIIMANAKNTFFILIFIG